MLSQVVRLGENHMVKVSISISFEWIPFGAVTLDPNDKILFPKSPPCAGLYRFEFSSAIGTTVYIGQTDQIARRFQHYRTPGPSQQTNLRLNQMMRDALANEGIVSVSIAIENISFLQEQIKHEADLTKKSERILLEHAAIVEALAMGTTVLNL